MSYYKRNIVAGEIYHVVNRGVDKRTIFMDQIDYLRFIHDLFEFNDQNPVTNTAYSFNNHSPTKIIDVARPNIKKKRELLVEIIAFCMMPNHYHLLLRPLTDDALKIFLKKLNMGYAKYFNEKYDRSGALFQGRYKSVPVTREQHFIYLPYYIHLNPLDLVTPEWRDKKMRDSKKAMQFLEKYCWSSHLDYLGKKNFPSVTQRDFLTQFFETPQQYEKNIRWWLENLELETVKDVMLE